MTKKEYIAQMRAKEKEAQKDGYSPIEVKKAYEISREMGVSYLSSFTLKEARERLKYGQ